MTTDTSVAPDKKLTGVALAKPDAPITREQELQKEFEGGLDKDAAPQLAKRIADLETDRENFATEKAGWEEQRESLLADTAAALAARDAAEQERDDALAAAKAAKSGERKAKASVTRATAEAKPRTLDASPDPLHRDALRERLADADKVEIAFSDGEKEIAGLPAAIVAGEAWRDVPLGLMLREPIEITGPDIGHASYSIDGYALLIDGRQVAYTKRSDALHVAGGQKLSLRDDIYF